MYVGYHVSANLADQSPESVHRQPWRIMRACAVFCRIEERYHGAMRQRVHRRYQNSKSTKLPPDASRPLFCLINCVDIVTHYPPPRIMASRGRRRNLIYIIMSVNQSIWQWAYRYTEEYKLGIQYGNCFCDQTISYNTESGVRQEFARGQKSGSGRRKSSSGVQG